MTLKECLLEMLRWADADEQEPVEGLAPQGRQAEGTFQQWSAEDLLAHLAAWKQRPPR